MPSQKKLLDDRTTLSISMHPERMKDLMYNSAYEIPANRSVMVKATGCSWPLWDEHFASLRLSDLHATLVVEGGMG